MHKALVSCAGLVPRHLALIPYLTPEEVQQLAAACQGRHRVRDALLIDTLFQTGLRISEALAIWQTSLGPDHPNVATALNNLALLLYATGRLAEAEPLSRRQLKIFIQFTRRTGHEHPHLRAAFNNYAGLLPELGLDEAEIEARLQSLVQEVPAAEEA